MASYLRPRRGKKSTAESQALVLKRGEVFFECPDTGVGTGAGKLKVGDGSTAYSSLPYFMEATDVESSTIGFTDCSTATDSSNNPTYLTNIKPANSLKTIFTNLKQLLYNYNSQLTSLNNDLKIKIKITSFKYDFGSNPITLPANKHLQLDIFDRNFTELANYSYDGGRSITINDGISGYPYITWNCFDPTVNGIHRIRVMIHNLSSNSITINKFLVSIKYVKSASWNDYNPITTDDFSTTILPQ